jgi:hypothetical protein
MKIDTLTFLSCILTQHSPTVFHPHISVLLPVSATYTGHMLKFVVEGIGTCRVFFPFQPVIDSVGDSFYKITSEALLVMQELVKVIRPFKGCRPYNNTNIVRINIYSHMTVYFIVKVKRRLTTSLTSKKSTRAHCSVSKPQISTKK